MISIGSDRKLFEKGSEVRQRLATLSAAMGELHVIVFTTRAYPKLVRVSNSLFLYPTNSRSRWLYIFDAIKLGKGLPGPDVITAQDPFESGLVAWWLSRFFKSRLQLQVHTDLFNRNFVRRSLINRGRVIVARFLLPRADCVRVVSEKIAASLKQEGVKLQREPIVLPVYIDTEKIKNAPVQTDLHHKYPQFKQIILMACRLEPEKQLDLAIRAMPAVLEKLSQAGLLIVGSGSQLSALRSLVASLGLSASVIFEPWCDDLVSYYKTADLFLLTSSYEGYGRTVAEAIACGLPVIATDVGSARELGAIILKDLTDLPQMTIDQLQRGKMKPFLRLPDWDTYRRLYLKQWS